MASRLVFLCYAYRAWQRTTFDTPASGLHKAWRLSSISPRMIPGAPDVYPTTLCSYNRHYRVRSRSRAHPTSGRGAVPGGALHSTTAVPVCSGGNVFGGVPQGEWRIQDNLTRRGGPCLGLFPWPRFPSYPQARRKWLSPTGSGCCWSTWQGPFTL